MNITLHIGAHRCASTTFQQYLRQNVAALSSGSVGFWGPRRTRISLFAGLFPGPAAARGSNLRRRAEARVQMQLRQARAAGLGDLLVSDENVIGSTRHCLRRRSLYPAIGERMARVSAAFNGQIDRVVLVIRDQEQWWASACAYAVARGHPLPDAEILAEIAVDRRGWRDVITDLACAMPDAAIEVVPFERVAARPGALLELCAPVTAPDDHNARWLNRAPDLPRLRAALERRGEDPASLPPGAGRWHPFTAAQRAALRENHADDLFWLSAGADGLATLTEDPFRDRTGPSRSTEDNPRGQGHDSGQGNLAQSG
ncbi:hypothetical protein ACFSUD_05650 [Sulfitobacter aestuarii]|uniref:Sulfotransferase family protein n=1 Tax=Sulfitobacter aestuarii TaxID=2161676 RepID=A0ABW5U0T7_9RHOB